MLTITSNIDDVWRQLRTQIEGATAEASRAAAQAGAQVFYEEVRARAPVSEKAHFFYGDAATKAPRGQKKDLSYEFRPGNLRRSIYQYYNKRLSDKGNAVYSIGWRHKQAPYGYMVEFGHSGNTVPAHPFLRPAYDAALPRAVSAIQAVMSAQLRERLAA